MTNPYEVRFYEPELGIDGTIPQLVDWSNKYTQDYSDKALEKISEFARDLQLDEKYIEIPLLLRNERLYENSQDLRSAYARLRIDHFLENKISLAMSNFGTEGTELEIWEEQGGVTISLIGTDEEGTWHAAGHYSMDEFMSGANNWLDVRTGEVFAYTKEYDEKDDRECLFA